MVHKVPENFNISDFDVFHSTLVDMGQEERVESSYEEGSSEDGRMSQLLLVVAH